MTSVVIHDTPSLKNSRFFSNHPSDGHYDNRKNEYTPTSIAAATATSNSTSTSTNTTSPPNNNKKKKKKNTNMMVVNRHVTWNESVRVQYFVVLSSASSIMAAGTSLDDEQKEDDDEEDHEEHHHNNMERHQSLRFMPQERQWQNHRPSSPPPPFVTSSLYPCHDKHDHDHDNDNDDDKANTLSSNEFYLHTTKTFHKDTVHHNRSWKELSSPSPLSLSPPPNHPDEFSLKEMRRMIDFICPNPSCHVPLFEPCKCSSNTAMVPQYEDLPVMNTSSSSSSVSFLSSFFVETLDTY